MCEPQCDNWDDTGWTTVVTTVVSTLPGQVSVGGDHPIYTARIT